MEKKKMFGLHNSIINNIEYLQLIAENMNISLADAEIAQARLWNNPELTIEIGRASCRERV